MAEMNVGTKKEEKRPTKYDIPEELACSICMEVMRVPTAAVPCMHTFCKKCIDLWLI
jgi:hypothetical protein